MRAATLVSLSGFLALALLVSGPAAAQETRGPKRAGRTTRAADRLVGDQWAILIAVNQYESWSKLRHAIDDVGQLKEILIERYDYEPDHVFTLVDEAKNNDYEGIFLGLGDLIDRPAPQDSVLIYFAGHGYVRSDGDRAGYWIPRDGSGGRRIGKSESLHGDRWISNESVVGLIREMQSRHILVVSDSCFSGNFARVSTGAPPARIANEKDSVTAAAPETSGLRPIHSPFIREAYRGQARQIITSGALEPVADNSSFAVHFREVLNRNMDPYLTPVEIWAAIRKRVAVDQGQFVMLQDMSGAGHEPGAEFVFLLRTDEKGGALHAPLKNVPALAKMPGIGKSEKKRVLLRADISRGVAEFEGLKLGYNGIRNIVGPLQSKVPGVLKANWIGGIAEHIWRGFKVEFTFDLPEGAEDVVLSI